ncbi:MAG: hypothetical protein AB8B73_09420 [Ekhidna sp.]
MKYKLDDIDKKQPFKVDDSYFEDLPLRIQTRVQKENQHKQAVLPSWKFAFAASVLICIISFFVLNQEPDTAEKLLAEIPQDDLIAYLDNMDLELEDITTALGETSNDSDLNEMDALEELDMDEMEMDDLLLEYDLNDDYL